MINRVDAESGGVGLGRRRLVTVHVASSDSDEENIGSEVPFATLKRPPVSQI